MCSSTSPLSAMLPPKRTFRVNPCSSSCRIVERAISGTNSSGCRALATSAAQRSDCVRVGDDDAPGGLTGAVMETEMYTIMRF